MSFQAIAHLKKSKFYWEVLSYTDTCFDKMSHSLLPKYKLLCESDVQEVEKKYGPRKLFHKMIARQDAIAKFMDYRVGDVVEICSKSAIAGNTITYRLVIDSDALT